MAQGAETGPDGDDGARECSWCERGSGAILILGAAGLLYIGLDLLTGGWLSRVVIGGITAAADAIDVDDDDGGEASPELSIGAELEGMTGDDSA